MQHGVFALPHHTLLFGLGVIVPEKVQDAVHHQVRQFMRRCSLMLDCLPDGGLLRNDDLAKLQGRIGWQHECSILTLRLPSDGLSEIRQAKGQHIGRLVNAAEVPIELLNRRVIGEQHAHGRTILHAFQRQRLAHQGRHLVRI